MKITARRRTALLASVLGLGGVAVAAPHAFAANQHKTFDAIVGLDNCSGSVVRFPGAADTDKALVLTNGHCLPTMPKPNTFVHDKAVTRSAVILGGTDAHKVTDISLDRILYSTMTGTDVALYRSTTTYADLAAKGVVARAMATARPADGTAIDIPSGYWKKNWSCSINGFVPELREGGYVWKDAIRYNTGCSTEHGSSGSPIVDTSTGDVIGINNTGNDDGERCTINNPCEVDEAGNVSVHKGQSYAEQTYPMAACYSAGTIDLTAPGCTLFGATPAPAPSPTQTTTPTPAPTTPTPAPTTPTPAPTTPAPEPTTTTPAPTPTTTTPPPEPTTDPEPEPEPVPADGFVNGDFEMGSAGWGGEAYLVDPDPTHPAHSGQLKLWMGGTAGDIVQTVRRTITVPADPAKATLSYWTYVTTQENPSRVSYDRLTVGITNGTPRARNLIQGVVSNADAGTEYVKRTLDLRRYAGQKVTLKITATQDRTRPTSFGVDDFAFEG